MSRACAGTGEDRVFTEGGARVLGNAPDTGSTAGLTSVFRDHGVGTVTATWGWKVLAQRVEKTLAAAA
jgi:hypothetical protein